jgi:hypothetical protein
MKVLTVLVFAGVLLGLSACALTSPLIDSRINNGKHHFAHGRSEA